MLISVIVPNWNGWRFLPGCLDSLLAQTQYPLEIMVVDNGSSDGSVEGVRRAYPGVRLLELARNTGFGAAVNAAIGTAKGEAIALFNNDAEAEPSWLAELYKAMLDHPEAASFASKMLLYDTRNVINSAGDYYCKNGEPGNRGVWQVDSGFDRVEPVFGACAGAALYRRELFDAVGLFDADLFAYCEDVDLSFRAQLAGFQCIFVPSARVYHRLSATGGGPLASYLCGRNFITVLLKNMPARLLVRHFPAVLAAQAGHAVNSLRHIREGAARARLRGQIAGLALAPKVLSKRRAVLKLKRVSDSSIERILV